MATTAAPWSTLSAETNLEFRGEFFNLLNHSNFLFAKSGPKAVTTRPSWARRNLDLRPRRVTRDRFSLALKFGF
jgi:hypothetical protein